MRESNFDNINTYAVDYFLGQGFRVFFERTMHDVKAGTFVFDGGKEVDKLYLGQAFHILIGFTLSKSSTADREEDVRASNIEEFHNNSTITLIDRILNNQHPGDFSFPRLSTIELVEEVSKGYVFHELEHSSKKTQTKLYELLLQVLEENLCLQITGEGISKDLLVYALQYVKALKSRVKGCELYLDYILSVFDRYNRGDVPYQKFIETFRTKLLSSLNVLASGLNEASQSTENLLNELRERGNNLMSFQSFAQAIKVYTEALLLAPPFTYADESQIYTNRAIAFIGLNCVPEAIDDLNTAIFLDRAFTPAWTQLGYCHLYMGNGLLALECYNIALKSSIGEVLPNNFPRSGAIVDEYRALRLKTILPQFIKRLSSAIALTEKRAYQQNVPEEKIKNIISDVRKLLARLRAVGPEDDRDCFTYMPVYRDSSLRDLSQRLNESRPNILTPEVSQNMLARNGMETATVTQIERPPHVNLERDRGAGDRARSPEVQVFGPMNSEAWPLSSLRDMIGDITEGGLRTGEQNVQQPPPARGALGNDAGSGHLNNPTNTTSNENANRSPRPNERPNFTNILPDALRNVLSPGILSTFERFTQGDGNGAMFVNGVEVSNSNNDSQGGDNANRTENGQQADSRTQNSLATEAGNSSNATNERNQGRSRDVPFDLDLHDDQELD